MKQPRRHRYYENIIFILLAFMILLGCSSIRKSAVEEENVNMAEGETTPTGSLYYDFGDILIPSELKLIKSKSFVYHVPGFTAGVLGLSGRVDINSLIRFFENSMAENNWKLVCSFKSPRTVLFYTKTDKICIINITQKRLKLDVEIWVAPTTEQRPAS